MSNEWIEIGAGQAWDYKTEKELTGVYISREENVGPNNSVLYQIEKENGEKIGVWNNTVLEDKFQNIKIGDKVKIEYLGMSKSKTGKDYHDFKVYHKKGKAQEVQSEPDAQQAEGMPF